MTQTIPLSGGVPCARHQQSTTLIVIDRGVLDILYCVMSVKKTHQSRGKALLPTGVFASKTGTNKKYFFSYLGYNENSI
jgi:hypothetical protein